MKKAYRDLVQYAINKMGYSVSVWDGEEWAVKKSTKQKEIFEAIESVEQAELVFYDFAKTRDGWALVSDGFPDEPDCTVIDYTVKPWMDAWNDQYNESISA